MLPFARCDANKAHVWDLMSTRLFIGVPFLFLWWGASTDTPSLSHREDLNSHWPRCPVRPPFRIFMTLLTPSWFHTLTGMVCPCLL